MPILSRKAVEEADGTATEGGGWGAADEGTLSDEQGTIVELAELGAKEKRRPLVRFVLLALVRSLS